VVGSPWRDLAEHPQMGTAFRRLMADVSGKPPRPARMNCIWNW